MMWVVIIPCVLLGAGIYCSIVEIKDQKRRAADERERWARDAYKANKERARLCRERFAAGMDDIIQGRCSIQEMGGPVYLEDLKYPRLWDDCSTGRPENRK